MSISKYKFVSPGVFVNEIDETRRPAVTPDRGPVIIGRTSRGPGMRPVQVNSFSQFIENFGNPVPGGRGGDVWRNGNYTSPMYATYAAQAWLRNGRTCTIIRLLGAEHTNKTTAGKAGFGDYARTSQGGGSYGLFLIDSGSSTNELTGTLAAVWYFPTGNGGIKLSGSIRGAGGTTGVKVATTGSAVMVESAEANYGFKGLICSGTTADKAINFNFDPDSDRYIRKVFNTNPILTDSTVTDSANLEKYWLAHTFDRAVRDTVSGSAANSCYGFLLGLGDSGNDDFSSVEFSDFKFAGRAAETGWIISQDLRGSTTANFNPESTSYITRLFRFKSQDVGGWDNSNLKISIANIKAAPNEDVDPYGTFDVEIRDARDSDHAKRVLEQFTGCNLNPNSPNFIARKVGNVHFSWDDNERRFRQYGDYPNVSKFVWVDLDPDVALGQAKAELLPFGFHGPLRPSPFWLRATNHTSALTGTMTEFLSAGTGGGTAGATFATSSATSQGTHTEHGSRITGSHAAQLSGGFCSGFGVLATSSFIYPTIALRSSSADVQLANPRMAYFGYDSRRAGSDDRYDPSNNDVLRPLPGNITSTGTDVELGCVFTLDDLRVDELISSKLGVATYESGSRLAGTSATALSGNYKCIIDDHGFNRFTTPMFGGWDGEDVTKSDPFANNNIGSTEQSSYVYNTWRRAIDSCTNPEEVDFNLMVAPGMTNNALNDLMISVCENRGDALAITDLPDVYKPPYESNGNKTFSDRVSQTVNTHVTNFKNRRKNSSYGATYYPWVQIQDSLNNAAVWVPPSVVVLGTFASSDRVGELWFAPAGFNRGGLSRGSAGLTVTNVTEKLTSEQRDKLYEVNINPIASFPNEGIVVFGQKTMDATSSALNRINVRRLLIFLKKEISRLANTVLFDQNVASTWARFKGLVLPLLESVKIRFGLEDFRMVLDETTTTPDLIDRNIMYAKIFLKPARAIEFIALDFIVTDSGAAFED